MWRGSEVREMVGFDEFHVEQGRFGSSLKHSFALRPSIIVSGNLCEKPNGSTEFTEVHGNTFREL